MKKIQFFLILLLMQCGFVFGQTLQDSLCIISIKWDTVAISPEIRHLHAHLPLLYNSPQNINILEIDLKKDKSLLAEVISTPQMQQTSITAARNSAVAAINGSFYNMKTGQSTCFLKLGKTIIDTTTTTNSFMTSGAIIIKDRKVSVVPWNKKIEHKKIKKTGTESILVSGPLLLQKGHYQPLSKDKFNTDKHPRSAVATTKQGKLLFITIDGRQEGIAGGMTVFELAQFIKLMGGKDGLNLDGGGSTTLWAGGVSESGVLNVPSGNMELGQFGERHVSNIVIIRRKDNNK